MTAHHAPAPSKVLEEIQMMLVGELVEHPTARTINLGRRIVVILQAAIGDLICQIEAIEEDAKAAERLSRELKIARAEIVRLELHAAARDLARIDLPSPFQPMAKSPAEGRVKRHLTDEGAEIIDISELLWREQMNRHRPTDGGAA